MTKIKVFLQVQGLWTNNHGSRGEGKRTGLFLLKCPSTVKCGGGGRYKPSEAFKIKTMPAQPTRRRI